MHASPQQPPAGEPIDGGHTVGPAADPAPGLPLATTSDADPEAGAGAGANAWRPPSAGQAALYVPVRRGPAGAVVRLWRTPFGTRTAVAFTSDQRLRSVLGPTHPWIRLSEAALRRLAEPLGARHLTVDPLLTARPPAAPAVSTESAAPTEPVQPKEPVQPTEPARVVESAAPRAEEHSAPDRQQPASTTP